MLCEFHGIERRKEKEPGRTSTKDRERPAELKREKGEGVRCSQKAEGVGFQFLHVGQLLFTC